MAYTTPIAPRSVDYSACHSGEATGMGGRVAATTAADHGNGATAARLQARVAGWPLPQQPTIGTLRVSVGGIGEVSDPASFFMCMALCISLIRSDLF
jgi:hypothetical protein